MASIASAVARIKDQPLGIGGILDADAVERIFADDGYRWRDRTLGPAQTLELFIRQVTEGNESCAYVRQSAGKGVGQEKGSGRKRGREGSVENR